MLAPPLAALVRRIAPSVESVSDADLVERFARSADQAAFELLVWRHGAMVWGACRRMLAPDHHAAEDACQATFVALAMHAARLRNRGTVAAWLHRVAVRAALDLRAARRPVLPLAVAPDPVDRRPGPGQAAADREVRALIDAGLDRLPVHLRGSFVLCELEGRSNAEAAAALGCPVGTVEARLTRARRRLRAWLRSHGVAPALTLGTAAFPDAVRAGLVRVGAAGAIITPAVRTLAAHAARSAAGMHLRLALVAGVTLIAAAVGLGLAVDPPRNPAVVPAKSAGPTAPEARADDPLPAGAIARLGNPRLRHGSRLKDIAYSHDGKRLASVGHDDTLRGWDADSGRQLFAVPRPGGGFDKLTFVADGAAIVALGRDPDKHGVLWRIDASTGKVLDRLKVACALPGSLMPEAAAVRFSRDGSRLAVGSAEKKQLLVIDADTAGVVWAADLGTEVPGGVAFAPDGKAVAVTTDAGRVHLFDRDGKPAAQFKTEEATALSVVALSPDGKLVTAFNRSPTFGELVTWDRATGRVLWTRKDKGGHGLAFTPDSRTIAECGSQTFASIVDAADGLPPGDGERKDASFDGMAEVRCLAVHPLGKVVAFGTDSGTLCLFDVATRKPVAPTADPVRYVTRLRFSADGKAVYGWALDWLAWDLSTGTQRSVTAAGGWDFGTPLSPDGRYTLKNPRILDTGLNRDPGTRVEIRDAASGRAVHAFRTEDVPGQGGYDWFDFAPDGKAVIGCQTDGPIQTWSLDGAPLARMTGHKGQVVYHAFAASAPVMVTATNNDPPATEEFPVRVWDLKAGKELGKFNPGTGNRGNGYPYGSLVALSGDGKRVAALTYSNSYGKPEPKEHATVWEVGSGKVLARVPQGGDSGYVALSPDGRLVAVSALWKNDVRVYEVDGGTERFHFRHAGEVTGLAFAPDGRTLAAASKEAPVYLWDVSGNKR